MSGRRVILLLSLSATLLSFAAEKPLLTNVADTVSLPESDFVFNRRLELTGRILMRHGGTTLFEDATGRVRLWAPHGEAKAGDRVRVIGRTRIDGERRNLLYVERFDILGHFPPPPPVDAPLADVARGRYDLQVVRVCGRVTDVFVDDIDPQCTHLILNDRGDLLPVLLPDRQMTADELLDAEVRIRGACFPNNGGWRTFCGPELETESAADIDILVPPHADVFTVQPLGPVRHVNASEIAGLGRRRVDGTVTAVWHGDRLLVQPDDGLAVIVELAHGESLPSCGTRVRAVGFPSTDLFRVILSAARWRAEPGKPKKSPKPTDVTPEQLFADNAGRLQDQTLRYTQLLRLQGTVRSLPTEGDPEGRMLLDCGGHILSVDATACPDAFRDLPLDSLVGVTGVCLLDADRWHSGTPLPRVRGPCLVLRTPDDIVVLRRPSWWTAGRLGWVVLTLFAALTAILVWNRMLNRLVDRRSRELLKEQVARLRADLRTRERTNLAVELHDALSQNLAALACQIAAGRSALAAAPEAAARQFETAERMLLSSRMELRRCLWDLRGEALEARDFTEALKTVLGPVAGKAALSVRFNVPRAHVNDTTAHAVLCIVRELVSNAVRHGHAENVRIAGEMHDGQIAFSVCDDGCGFDPKRSQGLSEGHFGLQGVRERVRRLNGTFTLESAPGRGTRAAVTLTHGEPT